MIYFIKGYIIDALKEDQVINWRTAMSIEITHIGYIDNGIDGKDQYLLVVDNEDDLTPEQAYDHVMPKYYVESTYPGSYFCTSLRVQQVQYRTNEVIVIVEHRYDN